MAKTLNGSEYRALRRLSSKENVTLAQVGETCERVPAESLPFLLASGKIVPVDPNAAVVAPAPLPPVPSAPAAPVSPRRRKEEQ